MIDIQKALTDGAQIRNKYGIRHIANSISNLFFVAIIMSIGFALLNSLVKLFVYIYFSYFLGVLWSFSIVGVLTLMSYGFFLSYVGQHRPLLLKYTFLLGFLYGIPYLISLVFDLLSPGVERKDRGVSRSLSLFYVVDKHINPITAFKIVKQK